MVAQLLHLGVSEAIFYRRPNRYGCMESREDSTRARRLKAPEIEYAGPKRMVAERDFDTAILRQADDYLRTPQAPRAGSPTVRPTLNATPTSEAAAPKVWT